MNDKYVLDLKDHIDKRETALVGREHGENLLKKLKDKGIIFKNIESKYAEIQIVVPKTIMSINKSFFLGFLETRIQELGTDGFRNKYSFVASDYILRKLDGLIGDLKAGREELDNLIKELGGQMMMMRRVNHD